MGTSLCLIAMPSFPESPLTSVDPYDAFLPEQENREANWASNRANKRVENIETANNDLEAVKQQLTPKETECTTLKGQLDSLQRANVSVVEASAR